MTTSFQIPDGLLQKADELAQQRGLSRDEVVVIALEQYLFGNGNHSAVTDQLNVVYLTESSALDPILARLQSRSLPKDAW